MPKPPTPAEMFMAMTEALKAPKGQMAKVLFENLDEIQGTVSKDNDKRLPVENGEEE